MKYLIRIFIILPIALPVLAAETVFGRVFFMPDGFLDKVLEWGKYDE